MQPIVIFGGGGHAKVVVDAIEKEKKYSIAGIINPKGQIGELWLNSSYRIISLEEGLSYGFGFIAVGDNSDRLYQAELILSHCPTFSFVSVKHPSAVVASNVSIGPGTIVMAGAVINSSVEIGSNVVVNTGAVVEHDCKLRDYSFVAPRAVLGGGCTLGRSSFVGMGAVVRQGLRIGENSLVGMGSIITKDTDDNVVIFGNPGKIIKNRKPLDRFFK